MLTITILKAITLELKVRSDSSIFSNLIKENQKSCLIIEVKTTSIPKIAISSVDDSSLHVLEPNAVQINEISALSPQYKSIMKTCSFQSQLPSLTSTTNSYFTCLTHRNSNFSDKHGRNSFLKNKPFNQFEIKKQFIDENDTENDVSELSQIEDVPKISISITKQKIPRRRGTIATASVLNQDNNLHEVSHRRQYSLHKNHSFTTGNNENLSTITLNTTSSRNHFIPHISTPPPPLPYAEESIRKSLTQITNEQRQRKAVPVRRTNSCRPSSSSSLPSSVTKRRFVVRDGKLIEQTINNSQLILQRRLTFDNSSYSITQTETSNNYETPKVKDNEQYIKMNTVNSIRPVTDTNLNTQSIVHEQSNVELKITEDKQQQKRVSRKINHIYIY